jgi:hypothetical protein
VMARHLESGVCGAIGVRPESVERLRWVDDALARAGLAERGRGAGGEDRAGDAATGRGPTAAA